MVERFEILGTLELMPSSGRWVRYSDYEQMERERDEAKTDAVFWSLEASKYAKRLDKSREREHQAAERLAGALEVADIESVARKAADAVGVTPHSDVRPFVEQAVKYALSALASHPCEPNPVVSHETANVRDKPDMQRIDAIADFAEPAGEVEPVAWQRLHPTEGWMEVRQEDAEHYTKMGQAIRPLYTTPPDASAIREALADDLVGHIVDDAIIRCRALPDYAGRPAWETAIEAAIRAALAGAKP